LSQLSSILTSQVLFNIHNKNPQKSNSPSKRLYKMTIEQFVVHFHNTNFCLIYTTKTIKLAIKLNLWNDHREAWHFHTQSSIYYIQQKIIWKQVNSLSNWLCKMEREQLFNFSASSHHTILFHIHNKKTKKIHLAIKLIL